MMSVSSDNKPVKSVRKAVNYTPMSIAALLFAAGFIVLHTLLIRKYFEIDISLFEVGTSLPKILYLAVAVYTAVCIFLGFFFQKTRQEKKPRHACLTGMSLYTGLLCGFAMLASAVIYVLDFVRSGKVLLFDTASDIVTAALIICTVPAAAYFIISAFGGGYRNKPAVVCGMFTVIWMALFLLKLYFEMEVSLNSPTRILRQLAVISVMFYMLQELRYRIGTKRHAFFRTFSALAVLFVGLSASSDITVMFLGGASDNVSAVFSYVLWCVGLYIIFNTFYIPSEEAVSGGGIGDEKKAVKERQRIREEREADNYLFDLLGQDNDVPTGGDSVLSVGSGAADSTAEKPDLKEEEDTVSAGESDFPHIIVPGAVNDITVPAREFFKSDAMQQENCSDSSGEGDFDKDDVPYADGIPDSEDASEKVLEIESLCAGSKETETDIKNIKIVGTEQEDFPENEIPRVDDLPDGAVPHADGLSIRFDADEAEEEQDTDDFDTSCDMEYDD